MAENAGTIYAEIRLKIDELKKGAVNAQKFIKNLEVQLKRAEDQSDKTGKKIGRDVKEKIKNPFEEAGKQVKIFGVELGSLGKAGVALAVVVTAFKAMAGAISGAMQKSKEYLENIRSLGLGYKTNAGSAEDFWKQLEKIKDETKNSTTAFDIASERMGGALDFWKMKITGVMSSLGNLLFQVKEADVALRNMQNANMDNYKARQTAEKAYEDELENIQYLQNALSGTRERAAAAEKEANAARQSANELYIRQLIQIRNNLLEAEEIDYVELDNIRFRIREQVQLLADQKKLAEQKKAEAGAVNLLTQAEETYRKTLAQIQNQERAGFISTEEAQARKLQAEQTYIQTFSGLRDEYHLLESEEDIQAANIAARITAHVAEAKAIETVIDYQKEYAAETERLRADYEKISAEMGNEATFAQLMASETARRTAELEKQRASELAALETRYAAIAAERESGELTEDEIAHRDMLTEAINKNYDAMRQLANTQGVAAAQGKIVEYSREIDEQYKDITRELAEQQIMRNESLVDHEKELALNELARNAALAELEAQFSELEAQREGAGLTAEEAALREELTRKINENYDAVAGGIKAAEKETLNFKETAAQIAQAGVDAFSSISSAIVTITQQRAQDAMAEIDKTLEETRGKIEEERLAALEAEGFIEAQRAENMQAQIDAAIADNDEVLQYQL
ncbi:MAG: hypothetical protein LBP69_11785 [Treponema sp.]|jgi:hypothetical protein|nr:hypothetical protein [Treponema sp.]